jgi:hypothetical protein
MTGPLDKAAVIEQLRARVASDLERAIAAQRETQRGATHEEAKPENDKDTRALEASYLARGLAERVGALEGTSAALARYRPRRFDGDTPIALFALVTLEPVEGGAATHYLVVPSGGGQKIEYEGEMILTVTLDAPLGRALLGAYEGDEIRVQSPEGAKAMVIERVA